MKRKNMFVVFILVYNIFLFQTLKNNIMPIVPYGTAIHKAAATGNLKEMKTTLRQSEKWMAQHGNVAAALEVLNQEIAKLEAAKTRKKK